MLPRFIDGRNVLYAHQAVGNLAKGKPLTLIGLQ